MISPLHMAFGFFTYMILTYLGIVPLNLLLLLISLVVPVILDLDHPIIYVIRKNKGTYKGNFWKFMLSGKSRSEITHSFPLAVIISIIISIFNLEIGIVYFFMHAGHIFLDILDKEGTPALWPINKKNYKGMIEFLSISSMSLFIFLLIVDAVFIFYTILPTFI